jgi:hypothetical protein
MTDFPGLDYDLKLLPGFVDDTSGNDTCASMRNDALGIKIFMEQADPARRENNADAPRFSVHRHGEDGCIDEHGNQTGGSPEHALLNTDDWAEVERFVEAYRPDAAPAP